MSKKLIVLSLTLIMLTLLSGLYVVGGTQAYSLYQQDHQLTQEHCGGQSPVRVCVRMPSALFSAFYRSYLASGYPLFSIGYSSSSPVTLLVKASIPNFSQSLTRTVNATTAMQFAPFVPPLQDQALLNLTAEENSSLHVEVTDTKGHAYYINDIPLLLHSRWLMRWTNADHMKIAAWVTPNDPAIVELVRRAGKHLQEQQQPVPKGMVGYDNATPQQVIDQVNAIYDALRLDYRMKYVQAGVPYDADGNNVKSLQSVKLPAEVLQQGSGMCVELTTVMASAVERIGLEAEIVVIPGHAFLGVQVDKVKKTFEYWDAVQINNNVAADSANVAAGTLYTDNEKKNSIVSTILIKEARNVQIGPMI